MALLLGVIGIYGVMSYAVSQRTREIGIRLALGLLLAAGLSRVMTSLLFGISPLDPLTFAVVPIVLATAAMLASYLPAQRATAVDPVEVLRAE